MTTHLGCYIDLCKPRKTLPPRRINTFAFANAASVGFGCFLRNQLARKTFAYANAAFAYANPSRGDVSPLLPAR